MMANTCRIFANRYYTYYFYFETQKVEAICDAKIRMFA